MSQVVTFALRYRKLVQTELQRVEEFLRFAAELLEMGEVASPPLLVAERASAERRVDPSMYPPAFRRIG